MAASDCPNRDTLYELLVGTMGEAEMDTVVAHVGDCPVCQTAIECLDESADAVISRLRRCSNDLENSQPRKEAALERLLANAAALAAPTGNTQAAQADKTFVPDRMGEYRLLEKLGEGGMGAVYKAEHTKLKRIVAVKILSASRMGSETAVARFEREMEAVGGLNHPNIVQAFDAREVNGIHFLVMEYIEGLSLSEIVAQHGPLPIADACELLRQAAIGLQYAHAHGLVHRDIKPSNLMMCEMRNAEVGMRNEGDESSSAFRTPRSAIVKILDLGLALLLGREAKGDGDLTETGQIAGTIDYMAPEQGEDTHGVDIRADIYSLGATMHKLLVGQAPLGRHDSPLQKMVTLATKNAPSLAEQYSEAPAELVAVVDRMMAKDPRERYSTPGDVAVALEPFCAGANLPGLLATNRGDTPEATPVAEAADAAPPSDATPRHESRKSTVALVGAVLLAVIAGGLLAGMVIVRIRNRQGEVVAEVKVEDGHSVEVIGRPDSSVHSGTSGSDSGSPTLTPGKPTGPAPPLAIAPFDASKAKEHQSAWAKYLGLLVERDIELRGGEKLTMVLIPPGEFMMGSTEEERSYFLEKFKGASEPFFRDHIAMERPQHRVRITKPFALSRHEVTRGQFRQFVEETGYKTDAERDGKGGTGTVDGELVQDPRFIWSADPGFAQTDDHPVVNMSWNDAMAFCQWLSEKQGVKYDLPTEAQWEYACRAGTTTYWPCGDSDTVLPEYVWFFDNAGQKTHPVGQLRPNAFGLHEMTGSVWEWCADRFAEDYYAHSPTDDPSGPSTGTDRVFRGGSCGVFARLCRSAFRHGWTKDYRGSGHGFRLAQTFDSVHVAMEKGDATKPRTGAGTPGHTWPSDAPSPAIAPFDTATAKRHQQAWAEYLKLPVERDIDLPGEEKLTMVLIPPGEFLMGSTQEEQARFLEDAKAAKIQFIIDRIPNEGPQHRVRISRPFYLGKHEVTQAQWVAVMGDDPSELQGNPSHPVGAVNWDDIQPFLSKLNAASLQQETKFVLPTEAQWEHACRAGTTTFWHFGDSELMLSEYGWFGGNADKKRHPVGELRPNAFGLYDMHGNVWEWCADRFVDWFASAYSSHASTDLPEHAPDGPLCVYRGGGRTSGWSICRSAFRATNSPDYRHDSVGFRLAQTFDSVQVAMGKEDVTEPRTSEETAGHTWPSDAPTPAIAPFDTIAAKRHQQAWSEYLSLPVEREVDLPGSEKLTLVLIPPGEFLMGSTEEEQLRFLEDAEAHNKPRAIDRIPSEGPQHQVRITRPFYLGKCEVTQAQWEAVMGGNPSLFKDTPTHPVEQASWDDIQPFLAKLNETLEYPEMKFVLPTEAQWEYACRAGTTTLSHFGDSEATLGDYVWFRGNSERKTHSVGQLRSNAFGLHDVHGNVYEWCADWYAADYYAQSPIDDPSGCPTGSIRVYRGGGWGDVARYCRSAYRSRDVPSARRSHLGFRLAATIDVSKLAAAMQTVGSISAKPAKPEIHIAVTPPLAIAPFDAAKAKQLQQAWAEHLALPVDEEIGLPEGEKLTMVLIPPGEFDMGLDSDETERLLDQGRALHLHDWFLEQLPMAAPRHRVRITRPFFIAKGEVTQAEFLAVMGSNPSSLSSTGEGAKKVRGRDTSRLPVERVTWDEAMEFCRRLNERPDQKSAGRTYRLPTEAEWEYACRSGTVTLFSFGDDLHDLKERAWTGVNSGLETHPVRQKTPNAWGLCDMHGNVYEWCHDWFRSSYDVADLATDPVGPESGSYRVQRGGCMVDHGWMCISAFRNRAPPEVRHNNTGFRIVCDISAPSSD